VGGQLGAYFYYYNTSDFVPNPNTAITFADGWSGLCKSSTVNFLITTLQFTFLPIFIHRSSPWKEPIYKNIALSVLILINIALIIPIYLFTPYFSFLDLQNINQTYAGIMLGITGGSCILCGIANWIIEGAQLHEVIQY
jgi:hypothetical protein